jgi:hypothetical protein
MVWQDIVIFVANLMFSYALLPQVIQGFKTKKGLLNLQTSLITTSGLYLSSIAFFSLNLLFSGIIASINATLWLILLIQRIIYGKIN